MKKSYLTPKIVATIINTIMLILIFYFILFNYVIWSNHIWTLIFGIWAGWRNTRNYYKNKKMRPITNIAKGSDYKMKEKKPTKNYQDLPDTITPLDYAEWRGCGGTKAREIFNSKGFPRLEGVGNKQLADKRRVLLHELGLTEEEKIEVLKEIARQII